MDVVVKLNGRQVGRRGVKVRVSGLGTRHDICPSL